MWSSAAASSSWTVVVGGSVVVVVEVVVGGSVVVVVEVVVGGSVVDVVVVDVVVAGSVVVVGGSVEVVVAGTVDVDVLGADVSSPLGTAPGAVKRNQRVPASTYSWVNAPPAVSAGAYTGNTVEHPTFVSDAGSTAPVASESKAYCVPPKASDCAIEVGRPSSPTTTKRSRPASDPKKSSGNGWPVPRSE